MSIVHVIIVITFIIIAIDIDDLDKKTIHEIKTIIGAVNDQDNKGGGNTYIYLSLNQFIYLQHLSLSIDSL